MAPLPVNDTYRVWIDYSSMGVSHSTLFRYNATEGLPTDWEESIDDFLIAMNQFMPSDWTFIGCRFSTPGAAFSLPMAFTPTAFAGVMTSNPYLRPAFFSLIGRSTGGRASRIFFLGCGWGPGTASAGYDYRLNAGEHPSLGAVTTALNALGVCAIDNLAVLWKPYANIGFNAYWQGAVR